MTDLPTYPLDADWRSFPVADSDPIYGASELDEMSWDKLPSLADWPRHLIAQAGTVHLRRRVSLQPTEICVRYYLHLDSAPRDTAVYVNGWHAGTIQAGQVFNADVTDYVTLDNNVILLKVTRPETFGRIYLQAVPCP